MRFERGVVGLGLLIVLSLAFGVIAQAAATRAPSRWIWLAGAGGWFVGGLFASEVLFGTATENEIQPIIDGLAFDEALLGGLAVGLAVVVATWLVTRGNRTHGPMST
jgi:hypothetical protein